MAQNDTANDATPADRFPRDDVSFDVGRFVWVDARALHDSDSGLYSSSASQGATIVDEIGDEITVEYPRHGDSETRTISTEYVRETDLIEGERVVIDYDSRYSDSRVEKTGVVSSVHRTRGDGFDGLYVETDDGKTFQIRAAGGVKSYTGSKGRRIGRDAIVRRADDVVADAVGDGFVPGALTEAREAYLEADSFEAMVDGLLERDFAYDESDVIAAELFPPVATDGGEDELEITGADDVDAVYYLITQHARKCRAIGLDAYSSDLFELSRRCLDELAEKWSREPSVVFTGDDDLELLYEALEYAVESPIEAPVNEADVVLARQLYVKLGGEIVLEKTIEGDVATDGGDDDVDELPVHDAHGVALHCRDCAADLEQYVIVVRDDESYKYVCVDCAPDEWRPHVADGVIRELDVEPDGGESELHVPDDDAVVITDGGVDQPAIGERVYLEGRQPSLDGVFGYVLREVDALHEAYVVDLDDAGHAFVSRDVITRIDELVERLEPDVEPDGGDDELPQPVDEWDPQPAKLREGEHRDDDNAHSAVSRAMVRDELEKHGVDSVAELREKLDE